MSNYSNLPESAMTVESHCTLATFSSHVNQPEMPEFKRSIQPDRAARLPSLYSDSREYLFSSFASSTIGSVARECVYSGGPLHPKAAVDTGLPRQEICDSCLSLGASSTLLLSPETSTASSPTQLSSPSLGLKNDLNFSSHLPSVSRSKRRVNRLDLAQCALKWHHVTSPS
ncbi:hypothetical protein EJ06DRAFT_177931 [Trichodelitschia bisporula]|uniref:Uncharacterized protein n=1 Tax=Trichodelitschia bisporula TaxID=703511 RepID=A0A6G1HLL8_9PEZI|nr:hypothetical protein EJ06DRAFT_177931 [Trichodelitschia bisporula]